MPLLCSLHPLGPPALQGCGWRGYEGTLERVPRAVLPQARQLLLGSPGAWKRNPLRLAPAGETRPFPSTSAPSFPARSPFGPSEGRTRGSGPALLPPSPGQGIRQGGAGHRCFGARHHQPLTSAALRTVARPHGPDPEVANAGVAATVPSAAPTASPSFFPTSRRCTSHDERASPDLRGTVSLNSFKFFTPSVVSLFFFLLRNKFCSVEETTCFKK